MGETIARLAFDDSLRLGKLIVETDEALTVGIVTLYLGVDSIESIVVAALTILRLVIDGAALYLHFASGEVALEVLHIGSGIPKTPLSEGEHLQVLHFFGVVLQSHLLNLSPSMERNKEEDTSLHTILAACDAGIVHTMAALIAIEWSLARFPTWVPDGVTVLDVEVATAIVHRYPVVAIAGDAAELGVLIEGVATSCVGDEREEILVAQIVDPRPWGLRVSNHVLAIGVIEMTVLFLCHCFF